MGAKTWMLVYSDGNARDHLAAKPKLNRDATKAFATKIFPKERLEPMDDGDLMYTDPPNNEIYIGSYPGVAVVAAKEFGIDYPSKLPANFLHAADSRTVYLHAMHSVVDWFAFAVWRAGKLERSLRLSPDSGILEDIGQRLPFELPYWSGQHPMEDYPLPFHPLELGGAALAEFFGYVLEGPTELSLFEPDSVAIMRFKRKASWYKFW